MQLQDLITELANLLAVHGNVEVRIPNLRYGGTDSVDHAVYKDQREPGDPPEVGKHVLIE